MAPQGQSYKLYSLTSYTPVLASELSALTAKEIANGFRKSTDLEENCPICQCELFENSLMTKGKD